MAQVTLPPIRHTVPGLGSKQAVRWPRAPQPIAPCRLHRERLLSCRSASTSNSSGTQGKDAGSTAQAFSKAAGRRYAATARALSVNDIVELGCSKHDCTYSHEENLLSLGRTKAADTLPCLQYQEDIHCGGRRREASCIRSQQPL